MKCLERRIPAVPATLPTGLAAGFAASLCAALLFAAAPAHALKSDRLQPLDVRADATDGTLGDGIATLRGNVEVRQGTLLIRADVATVEKAGGRVRRFELTGDPVHLQQEIEEQGLVAADAQKVEYEVASGIVTLTGAAVVDHPQYQISGEVLRYDLNQQHFQGTGGDADGRIQIRLDPEVISGEAGEQESNGTDPAAAEEPPPDAASG